MLPWFCLLWEPSFWFQLTCRLPRLAMFMQLHWVCSIHPGMNFILCTIPCAVSGSQVLINKLLLEGLASLQCWLQMMGFLSVLLSLHSPCSLRFLKLQGQKKNPKFEHERLYLLVGESSKWMSINHTPWNFLITPFNVSRHLWLEKSIASHPVWVIPANEDELINKML